MRFSFFTLIVLIAIAVGCSSGDADLPTIPGEIPTVPGESPTIPGEIPAMPGGDRAAITSSESHRLWGLWQFTADLEEEALEVVPLRSGHFHANVVPFLEPPTGVDLKISNVVFDGTICTVDVTLVHPFPGMTQFMGFDVCGILVGSGSMIGFEDPDIIMAGSGDTRLLNADGFTRWWNPVEFPHTGTILGYNDGQMGIPDSVADYDCTLNSYKVFGDDLGAGDYVKVIYKPADKVIFSPSVTLENSREYKIDFEGGVVFNYAVDANWEPPSGSPPHTVDDFPPEAHRPEAWALSITELENTLWNNGSGDIGGDLVLEVDVWDHFNADLNNLWADSPGNFDPVEVPLPIDGGEGYSTYVVEIFDAAPKEDSIDILIGVESESEGYWDILPGEPETGYFIYTAEVGLQPMFGPTAVMEATTVTDISIDETVSFDASASTGTPPLTFEWDFNDDGLYDGPGDDYVGDPVTPTHQFTDIGTFDVTVKVTNDWGEDISGPVVVHVGLDPDDIYVDGDYTGGNSDGSPSAPFLTVQEGMNAVDPNQKVHVDYLDGGDNTYYTDGLVLKSNVELLGDNWNGGGPGKPKLKNDNGTYTVGSMTGVSNFTLEGFEIGIGEQAGSNLNYGIRISAYTGGCSNVTIRHNHITDTIDDTGKTGGPGIPINLSRLDDSLIEFNEIGPLTWESETPGVYARVLWSGIFVEACDNIEIKNNFIHDTTVDYDSGGIGWGQIRVFGIHCYSCNPADVHNNLICHVEGINEYDYRIEAMMMEGSLTPCAYYYYNNTIDYFDHSTSNGGFYLRGIFIYTSIGGDSYINNTIMSHFYPETPHYINAYFSSPSNLYEVSYSTGYTLGSITDYFHNLIEGDGVTNYPGIDPQYVNNTTEPYDYHFEEGSGCEMGDPNFIDWDDTGSPSGNPNEPDPENRSRMGCFGGPDGDWDPYDL